MLHKGSPEECEYFTAFFEHVIADAVRNGTSKKIYKVFDTFNKYTLPQVGTVEELAPHAIAYMKNAKTSVDIQFIALDKIN